MKPTKPLLGFAALTMVLALAWWPRPVIATSPSVPPSQRPAPALYTIPHRRFTLIQGVPVATPRGLQLEAELLAALNARRAENGVFLLSRDEALSEVARERSADMVAHRYFSHTTSDGKDVYATLAAVRQIGASGHRTGERQRGTPAAEQKGEPERKRAELSEDFGHSVGRRSFEIAPRSTEMKPVESAIGLPRDNGRGGATHSVPRQIAPARCVILGMAPIVQLLPHAHRHRDH